MVKTIILTAVTTIYIIVAIICIIQSASFHRKGHLWIDITAAVLWPITYLILYPIISIYEALKIRQILHMVSILVFNKRANSGSDFINTQWHHWKDRKGWYAKMKRRTILKVAKQNDITIRENRLW